MTMSRSYKKNICVKVCYGDNRDFYKIRRRLIKNASRMQLRSLVAQYPIDEVEDRWVEPKIHMRDTWAEPTDGHYGMNLEMYNNRKYSKFSWVHYYSKQVKYYLKNKHNKRR